MIIPFPVRRVGASPARPVSESLPMIEVDTSVGWYHEAAMREDEAIRTH